MKVKIYPSNVTNKISLVPNAKMLHVAIICASLAKGVSKIKNVAYSNDVESTINWCRNLGAIIKTDKNKLTIKGVNNKIKLEKNNFKTTNSFLTFQLMLPLLSTLNCPVALKGNEEIIKSVEPYKYIFEKQNSVYSIQGDTIRLEKSLESGIIYIDALDNDVLVSGLLIAACQLKSKSKLIIINPSNYYGDVLTTIDIIKKFGGIVNVVNKTSLEALPDFKFKACKISCDVDYENLFMYSLIGAVQNDIIITKPKKHSHLNDSMIIDYLKASHFGYNKSINSFVIKKKPFLLKELDLSLYENMLPILFVSALFSKNSTTFYNIRTDNFRINRQFKTMCQAFTKLNIKYTCYDNQITITPTTINKKAQLESGNDPHVTMALSILAIIANAPLIIKNCECVDDIQKDFFNYLKKINVKLEFIHD